MRRFWSGTACLLTALLVVSATAGAASGRKVTVKVVEIAGGRAYVTPGEAAGVGVGSVVFFAIAAIASLARPQSTLSSR